jgi:hypothetical protein
MFLLMFLVLHNALDIAMNVFLSMHACQHQESSELVCHSSEVWVATIMANTQGGHLLEKRSCKLTWCLMSQQQREAAASFGPQGCIHKHLSRL